MIKKTIATQITELLDSMHWFVDDVGWSRQPRYTIDIYRKATWKFLWWDLPTKLYVASYVGGMLYVKRKEWAALLEKNLSAIGIQVIV